MKPLFSLVPSLLIAVMISTPVFAQQKGEVTKIVSKARAQIGPEKVLKNIETLRYTGTIQSGDGEQSGSLILSLKKPKSQRLELTMNGVVEVTASNGIEGFVMRKVSNEGSPQYRILNYNQVERVALTSFENLHFFEDPKHMFGRREYIGKSEYRGEQAHQVRFRYPSGMHFDRYFSARDGDLIGTIDDRGVEIVEEGELKADGLSFPSRIITYENGKVLHTLTFQKIEVNPQLDESLFEIPTKLP